MSEHRPPITAIDTRTAAFIGHIPGADEVPGALHQCQNWGDFLHIARLSPNSGRAWNDLAHAVNGFFLNGGSRCYVVEGGTGDEGALAAALAALSVLDDISIVAAPGRIDVAAYKAITTHCETARDRLAIFDGPARPDDEHLKVMAGDAEESADGWRMPPPSPNGFTTFYTPWLRVADPEGHAGASLLVPASGHIAGVWSANDGQQGVHKAPANLPVAGALDLSRHVTSAQQDRLNPRGVNVLRDFPGRGVLIWGARTLSPSPEWRYVSVRRLLTMIAGSICRDTEWAIHEPNADPLWARLREVVSKFLYGLWRAGMLIGVSPSQAFFVRCDASTMTAADIEAGRVIILIGVAVIRPSEFQVLRIILTGTGCEIT